MKLFKNSVCIGFERLLTFTFFTLLFFAPMLIFAQELNHSEVNFKSNEGKDSAMVLDGIIVIIAFAGTFLVGLIPTMRGVNPLISWGISCFIMPALILFDEFVLPYRGGGASLWPIAIVMAGIMGMVVGGLGTLIGVALKNRKQKEHK